LNQEEGNIFLIPCLQVPAVPVNNETRKREVHAFEFFDSGWKQEILLKRIADLVPQQETFYSTRQSGTIRCDIPEENGID
jgi:hypothetical protein